MVRSILLPYAFVWEKYQNFKRLLLWSLWASFAQISYGASLGLVNERLLKWSGFVDQDGHHSHIW